MAHRDLRGEGATAPQQKKEKKKKEKGSIGGYEEETQGWPGIRTECTNKSRGIATCFPPLLYIPDTSGAMSENKTWPDWEA